MKRLYVGNLPFSATEDMLRHIFESVGPVRTAAIPLTVDGRSRGFGFIEMDRSQDAAEAIARFNGDVYEGRIVTVAFAQPRRRLTDSMGDIESGGKAA
jgi:cold-inducible RNA-binding protein